MENRTAEDLGEEIISRLKELIMILEKKKKEVEDEEKLSNPPSRRNRIIRTSEKRIQGI